MLTRNGESDVFDLKSISTNDKFFLDVDRRGRIELSKFKLQNRYALIKLPLVRIDIGWLKQNISEYKVNDNIYRITLPFLDRNNDYVDIYILDKGNGWYTITDDGYTISDLKLGGFDIGASAKRRSLLDFIVLSYGINRSEHNELMVDCTENDLPVKKHMLAQCMVKVSDMFYLSRSNVQSIFLDDVQNFFDKNDIRYVNNICLIGKSKLATHYDFAVARSKRSPERLIKVVNNMDLNAARNIIFSWNDTKDMRQQGTKLYTFIQDTDKKISEDAIRAIQEYGINTALWTEKDKYVQELSA